MAPRGHEGWRTWCFVRHWTPDRPPTDPEELVSRLEAAPERSPEVVFRLARAYLEGGNAGERTPFHPFKKCSAGSRHEGEILRDTGAQMPEPNPFSGQPETRTGDFAGAFAAAPVIGFVPVQ